MNNTGPIIFTYKNRALGDAIISFGAIQYLKKYIPDSRVVFGVPAWVFPMFKNIKSAADVVIPIQLKSVNDWIQLYGEVKSLNPDIMIELFQSGRGKKFGKLYQSINKTHYYGNNHHLDDGNFKKSNIQRDIDGIRAHIPDLPSVSYLDFTPNFKLKSERTKKDIIIFGIVATRETKLWPIENYHSLAKKILSEFPNVKIRIPISQNKLDQYLKTRFLGLGAINGVEFLETSLEFLPEKIGEAKYYIGNDTGIKHLSIALGLRSLSFFGPEPPVEWHPYCKVNHPYYYIDNLECRTRKAHFCGLNECDSMICLNSISPDVIFDDLKKTLLEVLC